MIFYLGATVFTVACAFYGDRTGRLWPSQSWWGVITRLSMASVLGFMALGLLARGLADDPVEWFHFPILAAGVGVVVGHVGMRLRNDPPT